MMPDYKLLVVDIDGTIIDKRGAISDADRDALAAAAAAGVRVALSTGRVVRSCRKIMQQLSLDGCHIFYDGALVSDPSQDIEIYSQPIETELVRQAVEFARANDIYLELYTTESFYAERENWSDYIHAEFFGVSAIITSFDGIWDRERVIKAEMITRDEVGQEQARLLRQEFEGKLGFSIARSPTFPGIDFVNVINNGVSKGEALKELAAHLGISTGEVLAIGDGLNDISLLETAGLAVAMGNAFPEVKRVADCITLDVEQSGVAAAVKKLLL